MQKKLSTLEEIDVLIRSRYPIVYVVSWEEQRVQNWVVEAARARDKKVFEWSINTGVVPAGTSIQSQKVRTSDSRDPLIALDHVIDQVEPAIYIFKDLHPFLARESFAVVRKLKEAAIELKSTYKTIILISPMLAVPSELEKEITVVDFPLPGVEDFGSLLERIVSEVRDRSDVTIEEDESSRERLLRAALGLTLSEAENVFAKLLVSGGQLTGEAIGAVFAEKRQIIRKSGLLDYYETDTRISEVGGQELLKEWLAKRALAFTDRATEFGLPPPRGVFLAGVQGCGKSLCAKAVSSLWQMPLLRLDVGRMFGSLVGSSEENMRRAIQVAESIAPAVLWIDEIEKAFAGSRTSGASDSGTTARVFGTFLTWLSEKNSQVFVIATANDITSLPPELLRKGRFDDIFFVDLPNQPEREEILAIHLSLRRRDPATFEIAELAREADGFSGAEIEEAIVSALYDAFSAGVELDSGHIQAALKETVPLSKTMEADLTRLRTWAQGRARLASPPVVHEAPRGERKLEMERRAA